MKYYKPHPFTIFEYLYKFSFLFIIPLLQQLLIKPRTLTEIVNTFGLNIIVIFLIIAFSVREYSSLGYCSSKYHFYFVKGVFIKRRLTIPYKSIHSVTIVKHVIPSLIGSVALKFNTPAKKSKKFDIKINLSEKNLKMTLKSMFPGASGKAVYRANTFKVFLMSAFWSNSATGLLILSPFINKLGYLIGEQAKEKLYSTVNLSTQLVAFGVPPIAATLAYILLVGWVIAFLTQFFKYAGFRVFKAQNTLLINRGLISTYSRIIDLNDINAISIKQSLLMKLLGLKSIYINAVGNSKEKGEKNMLIAYDSPNALKKSLYNIIPNNIFRNLSSNSNHEKSLAKISPDKKSFKSFIFVPCILFFTLLVVSFLIYRLKFYEQFILLFFIFTSPILLWWILFRMFAYKHSSIILYSDTIVASGYNSLTLVSGNICLNKIQSIEIRQNILQKISKKANLKIYILSEQRDSFIIKHLNLFEVEKVVEKVNILSNK